MPITAELENVRKFESVGFTHEQAEVLTESLEKAVTSGHESLKDFIRQQNKELRNEIGVDIAGVRNEIKDVRNELKQDIKDVRNELSLEITSVRNELGLEIKGLEVSIAKTETRLMESQRDLMIKFITIVTAIVGIATAIIELF